MYGPRPVEDTAAVGSRVAADSAVAHRQLSVGPRGCVGVYRAYIGNATTGVAADSAVAHRQLNVSLGARRRGYIGNADAGVAAHGAVGDRQRLEARESPVAGAADVADADDAVGDGETGDGDVWRTQETTTFHFKHTGSSVPVDRKISSTRANDVLVAANPQYAAGQQNRARDAGGINRVARAGKCVAQRAGPAVIGICDYDDV